MSNNEVAIREPVSQNLVKVDGNVKMTMLRAAPGRSGANTSSLVQLTASLFFRDGAPRVIAMVSCKSQEGVSSLGSAFRDFLIGAGAKATLMPAADCLVWPRGRSSFPGGTFGFGLKTSESFLAAKEDSDVLLVDCSSLETSPSVFMLAAHVDGVLLGVEDGRNSSREMQKAVKMIKDANGTVLGVVLNKRQSPVPAWLQNWFSRKSR